MCYNGRWFDFFGFISGMGIALYIVKPLESIFDRGESHMKTNAAPIKLERSISFVGFLGMGIGCVFGSSWLLMTGIWMNASGGPVNALLAFVLGLVMLLVMASSYTRIIPMFPDGGGEMHYAGRAFGEGAALIAGWCGFLVNSVICAWQTLAIVKMLYVLFPALGSRNILYAVGGQPVTLWAVLIGIALVFSVAWMQYRGTKFFSKVQVVLMAIVITMVVGAFVVGMLYFDPQNLSPLTVKSTFNGTISLLVLLPFSIAGWENISKGVEEASASLSVKRIGQAMMLSIFISTLLYGALLFLQAGLMPWQEMTSTPIPFSDSLVRLTGVPAFKGILLSAAVFNIIGVFNGMFFGAVRSLYALGKAGLIPRGFASVHPVYRTPGNAIMFVALITGVTPFVGSAVFAALVNVAAFFYILLWGSTVFSAYRLRKQSADGQLQTFHASVLDHLGIIVVLILTLAMLLPSSPGALQWPGEYALLAVLIGSGFLFYAARPKVKSIHEKETADSLKF